METNGAKRVIIVTPEDRIYIGELYQKLLNAYKDAASMAGVKATFGKKGECPKLRHVVSFLREHSVYGDIDIQNFAARFVK